MNRSFSAKQLGAIIQEMGELLIGGGLRRIDQPQPWSILFEIVRHQRRHWLYFSAHPHYTRCHLLAGKPPNPLKPPPFCQLLRARLRHKRVLSIEQLNGDRVIQMRCAWPEEEASKQGVFVAELTGFSANFFLIDSEKNIIGSLSSPRGSLPSPRTQGFLSNGKRYQAPRVSQKSAFKEVSIPLVNGASFPLNRSAEVYYAEREEKEARETARKRILSEYDKSIEMTKKQIERLRACWLETKKSVRFQTDGETLKCHLHEIKKGDRAFHLIDPADPQQKGLVLELKPELSPSENMVLFFKRYKKGVSAAGALTLAIEKKQSTLKQLEENRKSAFEGEILEDKPLPFLAPKKSMKEGRKSKAGPPVYLSADNVRLILGRNARENEEVTFRIARGNDLWFHARNGAGTHLVVRMERREKIPYQTLLDAAILTHHFSKISKEAKAEILYTHKKYVQRPKKGKLGAVILSQEKTIYIKADPSRLERILQNRLDKR